jgi:hypothetical protein
VDIDFGQVATVLAVLIPAGTAIAQLATIRERVSRHDRSIENFGQRFEREKEERSQQDAKILERLNVLEGRRQENAELSRPYHVAMPRDPAAPR